jgi:hypothetical protein
MKKRQQRDDENKKEEIVMTTLRRRATLGSIKYRSIGKSRQKQSHIRYMEMSGEYSEELQKMVTPQ